VFLLPELAQLLKKFLTLDGFQEICVSLTYLSFIRLDSSVYLLIWELCFLLHLAAPSSFSFLFSFWQSQICSKMFRSF